MSENSADPIAIALLEDIGAGDVTTQFFVPYQAQGYGRIIAREACVIAGTETAAEVFRRVDPNLHVDLLQSDGTTLTAGETLLEIRGPAASILTAERVALNFLQRLSGIATITRQFVEAIGEHPAKILDTRKTTPGLRALEKAAVVADNLEQVRTVLEIAGVDVILLDNMKPAEMREAVALGKKKIKFEASGGVTLKNVRRIAATGVDYISVGALTHSARAIDLSLELTYAAA